jgi:cephalosporin-C deacetylase
VSIAGEGLGGGLAVIAAAQLSRLGDAPARLVASLPDLGDWPWRVERFCSGPGGLINMVMASWREHGPDLLRILRLYDAALHAADASGPALFHLAARDDVVPAPTAAAVANAWSRPDPARFVTRYGHYDGGLSDGRRRARIPLITANFIDPTRAPAVPADVRPDRLAK